MQVAKRKSIVRIAKFMVVVFSAKMIMFDIIILMQFFRNIQLKNYKKFLKL